MILFENSASVFELMWDIALTLFITRISFVYCTIAFLSSWLLTYSHSSPLIAFHTSNSLFFTLNILSLVLISRLLIKFYEIPRVLGFRLAIGLTGLLFMILADVVGGWYLTKRDGESIWVDFISGVVGLAIFALMPALWMCGEKLTDGMGDPVATTAHGHEQKKILEALPKVIMIDKKAFMNMNEKEDVKDNAQANGKANGKKTS